MSISSATRMALRFTCGIASPAPTQQWKHLPDGQFQNVQTGKCLAVREDSSENGTVLHIWDCHPGQTEKWSFGY